MQGLIQMFLFCKVYCGVIIILEPMSNYRGESMLSLLPAEKSSMICIIELLKIQEYDPINRYIRISTLCKNIGSAIEREIFAGILTKKSFLKKVKYANQVVFFI